MVQGFCKVLEYLCAWDQGARGDQGRSITIYTGPNSHVGGEHRFALSEKVDLANVSQVSQNY